MNEEKLKEILEQHEIWLETDKKRGRRADLTGADLVYAKLEGANLIRASLKGADLKGADLTDTKFK